jgi:hypothetical protein
MSDTLDRLKALNSKLEAKLSQKKGVRHEGSEAKAGPVSEEKKGARSPASTPESSHRKRPDGERAPLKETILLRGQEPREVVATPPGAEQGKGRHEEGVEATEVRRLGQILIHHLGVDSTREPTRAGNLEELAHLYLALNIPKKAPDVRDLFIYKAMNISGIGLKEEDFGEIREGKYVQVIAITYEPDKNGKKKAKNISLGYFGKAETLDPVRKNQVIEFVLRWRYEKAFQNLEHYRLLLEKVLPS